MTLDVLRDWCGPMTRRWLKEDVGRWDELPPDHQPVRVLVAVLIAICEFAGLLVATVALGLAVFGVQGINGVTLTIALAGAAAAVTWRAEKRQRQQDVPWGHLGFARCPPRRTPCGALHWAEGRGGGA